MQKGPKIPAVWAVLIVILFVGGMAGFYVSFFRTPAVRASGAGDTPNLMVASVGSEGGCSGGSCGSGGCSHTATVAGGGNSLHQHTLAQLAVFLSQEPEDSPVQLSLDQARGMLEELRKIAQGSMDGTPAQAAARVVMAHLNMEQSDKISAMFSSAQGSAPHGSQGSTCDAHPEGTDCGSCQGHAEGSTCSAHPEDTAWGSEKGPGGEDQRGAETPGQPSSKKDISPAQKALNMTPDQAVETLIKLLEKRVEEGTTN